MLPVDVLGQAGKLELHHQEAHEHDAEGLAHQKAEEDAEEHRGGEQRPHVHTGEADVGVGQGEQRQDAEIHPRIQLMLQARGRRHHLASHVRQVPHGFHIAALRQHGLLRVEGAVRLADLGIGPGGEGAQVHARAGRDGEGQQHAGDGGMHARHIYAVPQQGAHQHIREQGVHMPPVHGNEHGEHHACGEQPRRRGALAVEDGDDQDGDYVICHGECGQEHAHAGRHAVAQKRKDTQRERDVGCRGHAPAAHGLRVSGVEHQVDGDRRQNAADRRQDGQHRLADVGQLAYRELVFHFQAHQ